MEEIAARTSTILDVSATAFHVPKLRRNPTSNQFPQSALKIMTVKEGFAAQPFNLV